MSWSTPRTWTSLETVTASIMNTHVRDQFDALLPGGASAITYTSTWSTNGAAPVLGNGTLTGRYVQHDKLVCAAVRLLAGNTTTFGTGAFSFSLPVAPLAGGLGLEWVGGGMCFLSGFTTPNEIRWRSDGTVCLSQLAFAFMSGTSPLTLTTGSEVLLGITYIAN